MTGFFIPAFHTYYAAPLAGPTKPVPGLEISDFFFLIKEAGVPPAQAEAEASALSEVLDINLRNCRRRMIFIMKSRYWNLAWIPVSRNSPANSVSSNGCRAFCWLALPRSSSKPFSSGGSTGKPRTRHLAKGDGFFYVNRLLDMSHVMA